MKNILITGLPGVGKTTLTKKIVEKLKTLEVPVDGFYTEEIRNERRQRIGFDIISLNNGERVALADKSDVPSSATIKKLGQYTVYLKNVEDFAVPIMVNSRHKIIVIDELGKMELFSKKFEQAVRNIIQAKNVNVIATVPVKGPPFVNHLKEDSINNQVFEVTEHSRDQLVDEKTF